MAESGDYDYILHGCNCFHAMGSGIAGDIAKRYPHVPNVDRRDTEHGDPGKLGTWTEAVVNTRMALLSPDNGKWQDYPETTEVPCEEFTILNCYTQYQPGKDFLPSIFPKLIRDLNEEFSGQIIGLPAIGCGIAGSMANMSILVEAMLKEGPDVDWELVML